MIIRGRVVDAEGRPVAGAQVFLDHGGVWIPASAHAPPETSSTTDAAAEYVFDLAAEPWFTELHWPAHLRAFLGTRVSRELVLDWEGQPITVPDLVLEAGVMGRVKVAWDDGSPVARARLLVILQERSAAPWEETDDRSGHIHSAVGETDAKGEMSFGPAPDHEFERATVDVSHPEAPRRTYRADLRRLSEKDSLDVVLARGRKLRGTLRTADGRPATGYRVAPFGEHSPTDPRSVVKADSAGRFEVAGVDRAKGLIAFYDRLPDPLSPHELATLGDEEILSRKAALLEGTYGPLLLRDVADDRDDIGVLSLPEIGTLTLHIRDARGERPRSARAFWTRSNGRRHGSISHYADSDGILCIRPIPMGIAVALEVFIEDSRHGAIEQRFAIRRVRKKPTTLRVTGAGTVVFYLHPKGAPEQPLAVRDGRVFAPGCIAHGDDPASELRGWTSPGFYPSMNVTARGFKERVLENLKVSRKGPTFLDVELEPR